jgi:hypothetical protein
MFRVIRSLKGGYLYNEKPKAAINTATIDHPTAECVFHQFAKNANAIMIATIAKTIISERIFCFFVYIGIFTNI